MYREIFYARVLSRGANGVFSRAGKLKKEFGRVYLRPRPLYLIELF